MPLGDGKDVIICDVEFGFIEIRSAVAAIVFVEGQQPMLAVIFNATDKTHQTLYHLFVGLLDICHGPGAEIDLELETMKRTPPSEHFRINESVGAAGANSRDVRVIVNQPGGIDFFESALD